MAVVVVALLDLRDCMLHVNGTSLRPLRIRKNAHVFVL